jgi:hypothetical protein
MHIKMTTTVTGPGTFYARNMVYEVSDDKAGELLKANFAVPAYVESEPATPAAKRETAVRKPKELR